ncbi:histidine kinase [Desulfobaculum xiamenense]|uniref:histidine kinase n=1 Tax=Desulfobaculum xiamenense TaxID=995050 RepID=A0A846QQ81_9BACT|nr:PAS domain S-box protein [Desulfobaculum xiamenense]NJB68493.1 histidine kinase [Desulfobaculum xiamenense]
MRSQLQQFRHSLLFKIILSVGLTLLLCVSAWSYFSIRFQRENTMRTIVDGSDRLSDTTRLALHYAMLHNSRDDIRQIVRNTGRQKSVEVVRIYDKTGTIQFSSRSTEEGSRTNIRNEACHVCHSNEPPLTRVPLEDRTRIFTAADGARSIAVLTPIYNEPTCSGPPCHFHPEDTKVLGALDMVMSLKQADAVLANFELNSMAMAAFVFLATSWIMIFIVLRFVKEPVKQLIAGTRLIAAGREIPSDTLDMEDEMGQLVAALNRMGRDITAKQSELNKQRDLYRAFFDNVPCLITVLSKDLRLIDFNREFADRFSPKSGDFCYHAWKGRDERCEHCPVQDTFIDGRSRCSEESGVHPDGSPAHWIVTTQPIRDENGTIVAAMEMCLDITQRRTLEQRLEKSEKKYHDIFNHIPNPVFVLDAETLAIIDCNDAVGRVYEQTRAQLAGRPFPDLFADGEDATFGERLKAFRPINRARHRTASGRMIYVDIMASPSELPERRIILAITRDITKRLETEQQLIQAGKMATLGEMATGVAHELNQPLTVIQTIASYLLRKVRKNETVDHAAMTEMAEGIRAHVERASKIITHMREFGRKSDIRRECVDVNAVLERAFEIFDQQLRLRSVAVERDLAPDLPRVMAEPNRLEQVFINLLLNARDSIEARTAEDANAPRRITLITRHTGDSVEISIADTGTGFADAIADRLFEPFFTTKEVGRGTGLGLSISYGIVTDYNGSIRAQNAPDGGARFIISFPVAQDDDTPSPA